MMAKPRAREESNQAEAIGVELLKSESRLQHVPSAIAAVTGQICFLTCGVKLTTAQEERMIKSHGID